MDTHDFFTAMGARALDLIAKARIALGIALIAAGVLVAVFPQILVILVASLIVSAGIGTFASGLRMRRRIAPPSAPSPRYRVGDAYDA